MIPRMLYPASGLMPETAGRSRKSPVGGLPPLTQCRRRGRYNGRFEISDTPTGMARGARRQCGERASLTTGRRSRSRQGQPEPSKLMEIGHDGAGRQCPFAVPMAGNGGTIIDRGRDGEQVVRRGFQAITGPTPKSSDAEPRLRESSPIQAAAPCREIGTVLRRGLRAIVRLKPTRPKRFGTPR